MEGEIIVDKIPTQMSPFSNINMRMIWIDYIFTLFFNPSILQVYDLHPKI